MDATLLTCMRAGLQSLQRSLFSRKVTTNIHSPLFTQSVENKREPVTDYD